MTRRAWIAAAAFALAAAAPIAAQHGDAVTGYLAPGALDMLRILPPAPERGSYRYEADRRVFRETRRLEGSQRWRLATADVETGVPAMMRNFSCAAGVALTPETAPRTAVLLTRVRQDYRAAVNPTKDHYRRQRPFLIDRGPICQPRSPLDASFDYPSGHTTWGWSVALTLAEAVPARASEILTRGRAYGESRVVCGAHNASAIEAGRTTAAALLATLHGVPEFRDDVAAARSEIAALRGSAPAPDEAPDAALCAAEAELIAPTPY